MSDHSNSKKIEFAPGCFDEFEGTQEEMAEIIAHLTQLAESGELELMSEPVDIDELIEEDPELARRLSDIVTDTQTARNLH
jgi:hypothetical protein